jgi:thiol-disulfide isomerase/thioredoxin
MYRPDYDLQRRRRGSRTVTVLFLGLLIAVLFGALSGLLPIGKIADIRERSPNVAHAPPEAAASAQVSNSAAVELSAAAPVPTIAAQSRNGTISAPEFVLPDLFEESLNRSLVGYRGRPVILNFWASWCVPCKDEMPALQRAFEKYRAEGLVVLGVNQTFIDDLDAARDFVDELALTFPSVRDDTGNTSQHLYQVMGLPTSVLITANGEIAHRQIGQMTDEQIDTFSRQLIAGEAITP